MTHFVKKIFPTIFILFSALFLLQAQEEGFSRFDFGRMWTFEDAPLDYFNETYDLDLDQAWMDKMRKSALRFSSFCSASFVSDQGLIMTNHHCSRGLIPALQKENENLLDRGFYAATPEEERKAEGLYVDQLIRAQDITREMKDLQASLSDEEARTALEEKYKTASGWEDLRLQIVTYYSGGKYALYGYKRFNDIRLVLLPENDLGYFGGDPDNFTFPRYNLDVTFWRAYDESGKPLNTSENYYPFNPDGIQNDTPVFVVGNPGSTERYRTMTQLEYDRNVRRPAVLTFIESSIRILESQMEANPDPDTENTIFSLKNAQKAYTGMYEGLFNEDYMARKGAAEGKIREETESGFSADDNPWKQIDHIYAEIAPYGAFSTLLNPSPYRGKVTAFLHQLAQYMSADDADTKEKLKEQILSAAEEATSADQEIYLQSLIDDYQKFSDRDLASSDAQSILSTTLFRDANKTEKWLEENTYSQPEDPLAAIAKTMIADYDEAVRLNQLYGKEIAGYNEAIAHAAFEVFGNQLPPDATFTLRISDGRVTPFSYNGTVSPIFTTYFGLYDRYYSHQKKFPWSLPQSWLNPSMDLLRTPLNFVSTNDIVGGNSGSAVINAKGEAVGLAFDGNIKSLPGDFIFDENANRSVSVHAGGIIAAMKHIYKADRILQELLK